MKKILIISYHYPPDSSVGRLRALKFAKYLPEYGYEPTVLTVNPKYHEHARNAYEIDGSHRIVTTSVLWTLRDIYVKLKEFFYIVRGRQDEFSQSLVCYKTPEQTGNKKGLKQYLKHLVLSLIYLPDEKVAWVPLAILKGLSEIRRNKIDAIFTTSPPHSTHLIGLVLRILTGKIWIADFRDPWMIEVERSFKYLRTGISMSIGNWMERKTVEFADVIVSVTDMLTDAFRTRYPRITEEKFVTMLSGFDADELNEFIGLPKEEKFTIIYAGNLFLKRNPIFFLTALAELLSEKAFPISGIQVKFIGFCRYYNGEPVEEMARRLGVADIISFADDTPYREVLVQTSRAHVGLLLAPDQPYQIPGKTYELLGLGVPILALTDSGSTRELLKNIENVHVVMYEDVSGIKKSLREMYTLFLTSPDMTVQKTTGFSGDIIDRKDIAHALSEIMNELLDQRRGTKYGKCKSS